MARKKKNEIEDNSQEAILAAIQEIGAHTTSDIKALSAERLLDTGIWGLNYALGHGGIPSTFLCEVHGPNGCGKTSLALYLCQQAKNQNFTPYYIDMEYAVNDAMASIFISNNDISWIHPDTGEKALDIITLLLKTTKNSFIVLDSVSACTPSKIEDASAEDSFIGLQARMLSLFGPKAGRLCKRNNNILFCLNHESVKINRMGTGGYNVSGGTQWSYTPDLRIRVQKRYMNGDILEGEQKIGHVIKAEITKNRHGPPFRIAEIPLIYGQGFDTNRELIENAINFGAVKRAGAWYTYEEEKHQGIQNLSAWMAQNPKKREQLIKELNDLVL